MLQIQSVPWAVPSSGLPVFSHIMIKFAKTHFYNAEMGFFFLFCTTAELEGAGQLVQKLNAYDRVAVFFCCASL